jgi:hypothetical protein
MNLSLQETSVLDGVGLALGLFYAWAAIIGAWELYGGDKP